MAHFDGSKFIAPNASGLAADQPLDAWAEAIFRADELWLLKNGNWHHHGLWREQVAYNTSTGDRAYASAQPTCWFSAPYYVLPTMSAVDVVICGRVQTAGAGAGKVVVTAELAGVGKIRTEFSETSNYEDLRLTIPITKPVAAPFMTQLRLWVTSNETGDISVSAPATDTARLYPCDVALDNLYNPESFPAPSSSSYNEQATSTTVGLSDHIRQWAADHMIVYPDPGSPFGFSELKRVYLSYLQVRGFTLREHYTPQLYPASEIRALIPVLGQTTSQHPAALLAALRRPQLLSLGHPGELDYSRVNISLPEGYTTPFQWMTALGSWEDAQTVWSQPVLLDEADVELEIRVLYVPTHVLPDYSTGKLDDLLAAAAVTDWELELSAVTYSDASATPAALGSATTQLVAAAHLPTDQSGVWPFLLQRRWSGAEAIGTPSAYEPGEIRPTYKEGQLFGPDFALLSEAVIRLPLTSAPTDKAVCLSLTAARTGTITINAPTAATNPDDADRIQLVIVGMSVWAHHTGSATPATAPATSGKTIADKADIPSLLRYAVGQPVRSADWQALAAQANRLWARRGSRGIGRVYREGSIYGNAWVTDSTTPTAESGVADVNERLSNHSGPLQLLHEVEPDRGAVRVYLEAHGRNCSMTCEVTALDTGASLGTITRDRRRLGVDGRRVGFGRGGLARGRLHGQRQALAPLRAGSGGAHLRHRAAVILAAARGAHHRHGGPASVALAAASRLLPLHT
jgi:hypothetical protein